MKKKSVLWLLNIPSPYKIDFFNEFGKYCELTAVFERKKANYRDNSWNDYNVKNFKAVFPESIPVGVESGFIPGIISLLKKDYDVIVIGSYHSPTGMLAISYMRIAHIPYVIIGDGGIPKEAHGINVLKEKVKSHFIRGASRYLSTGKTHDQYYRKYGADMDRVRRLHFSSIWEKDILDNKISDDSKNSIRKELGIGEEHVILYVGQFIYRKGLDILLGSTRYLGEDTGIYMVGGNIEDYLNVSSFSKTQIQDFLNNPHIHSIPFKPKNELTRYYQASDVFVFPTREDIWGLVVNEAMANGLPVISSDKSLAATEMIEDGVNGILLYDSMLNDHGVAEAINSLIYEHDRLEYMSINALKKAREYTVEKMVDDHVKWVLNEPYN